MGYALFAIRKQILDAEVNSVQLQQTQRSNEQYYLATTHTSLQKQVSSLGVAQAQELAELYRQLSETTDTTSRNTINDQIHEKQEEFKSEEDAINNQIYEISIKENAIQLEVKRLDTVVTTLKEQLQAVQDAEGDGIKNATPKFRGIG